MKSLDSNHLFLDLDPIRREELRTICGYALDYCKEHDLRSPMKTINEYAKIFRGNYTEITTREELDRR